MKNYDHKELEPKWQKKWETDQAYKAEDASSKPKFYALIEFPFPSGDGMHTGHLRSNTAMDIIARKRRAEGFNVLYPIGWDAFGLPTENYAIKSGIHPSLVTKQNSDNFRRQLKSVGFSFDWSREINTTDPKYYKWTQWIFIQLFKKGLAYKSRMTINWCPKDKIGLANEEVVAGCCERCGTPVEKREKEQWMLAITKYADRLFNDLDTVDYLPRIKTEQKNWIGRSEGMEIEFKIEGEKVGVPTGAEAVKVFTTRIDTIFGVTYLVLAPEHPLVETLKDRLANAAELTAYVTAAKAKNEIDRTTESKEKTGVELKGINAINPANGEKIPVWVADYVLGSYATGAVMAVPAHDERDYIFAQKFGLPIREVIMPSIVDHINPPREDKPTKVRKNVHAIVYDPKEKKYLTLHSNKFNWNTVVMGGLEEGESVVDAALREIREETGYIDLVYKMTLGGQVQASYFAQHKDENRVALATGLYFELVSDKKVAIAPEEEGANEIVWRTAAEFVPGIMVNSELPLWLARLKAGGNAPYDGEGILINSGKFDGEKNLAAGEKIAEAIGAKKVVKYKLRDWIFSRQRYWGEPIPMVNCPSCGWVPLPENELPLELPQVENYTPTDTGESPLSKIESFVATTCPTCKAPARRETDTMPNWAGSSWYYLRYADPHNDTALASKANLAYWTPVDWYNGGMEHTTLHLLYSRFWHKFLFDIGIVATNEPYKKRTAHGFILAENNEKMSKSRGNVVNPDKIIETYGADTLRIYEMFAAPFEQAFAWNTESIIGPRRFIERVWKLQQKIVDGQEKIEEAPELIKQLHRSIKKVGEDIETMSFNTAISQMMILVNEFDKAEEITRSSYQALLQILAPFAPHVTEELWNIVGNSTSIHIEKWPKYDESKLTDDTMKIILQVNGKVRGSLMAPKETAEQEIKNMALNMDEIKKWTEGKEIKKFIYVKERLANIVV